MKDVTERVKAIAEKMAAKENAKAAVITKHKPAKGKKLTTDQRLARIEELLGIADDA